jgi:hypothetical protein
MSEPLRRGEPTKPFSEGTVKKRRIFWATMLLAGRCPEGNDQD